MPWTEGEALTPTNLNNQSVSSLNVVGHMLINEGTFFPPNQNTALYVGPQPISNWTMESQGIQVQHRITGSPGTAGAFVHDAIIGELFLTSSHYTNGTGNGVEASIVMGGGNSQYTDLRGLTANINPNSGATGNLTFASVIRGQQILDNSSGLLSIGTAVSVWAEQQTVGGYNRNVYAPGGISEFGSVLIINTTGQPLLVGSAGDSQQAYSMLDGLRISGDDQLNTLYNSNRSLGITADSGVTIFIGQTSSTVTGVAINTANGSVKFASGATINLGGAILSSIRSTNASATSATLNDGEFRIAAVSTTSAELAWRSGNTTYRFIAAATAV